jgi:hypothetical protein
MLRELIAQALAMGVYEKRHLADHYCELVVFSKDIGSWNTVLGRALGGPTKPAGTKPSRQDLLIAQPHGGISKDQVLYGKQSDAGLVSAMLWPWSDGEHITLKLFLAPPSGDSAPGSGEAAAKEQAGGGLLSGLLGFFRR